MNKSQLNLWLKNLFIFFTMTVASLSMAAEPVAKNNPRILIIYFSQPEDVTLEGVDGVSGASILKRNSTIMGSTQYVAQIIQRETGGDLFRIETLKPYPRQHEPLLKYSEQEQKEGIRPELKEKVSNLADYDQVFIGYPIWWYKMPMVMYRFLEQHDLSGKKVIPFTTHGGSRFSDSIQEIRRLQPNAQLITPGLAISRNDVTDDAMPKDIISWLNKLANKP